GLHDQREDPECRLRERLRARRAPRLDAHVGLGLEVLPAPPVFAHQREPRSPKRAWSTAMIAGPAVSVLRMRGPTPTIVQPRACAAPGASRLRRGWPPPRARRGAGWARPPAGWAAGSRPASARTIARGRRPAPRASRRPPSGRAGERGAA